ncbi:YceD family protein [Streptosporangium subroseum]|uniref:YceD family protein n=1 Tax=Streptosporangium subroseum TaxID=106412 RepID=UPI00308F73CE|nr:YceD family protein [Streptosporangium subroseum]
MTQRNLNPRAPWVLSTHELGRRPGLMRQMNLVLPAPADIGVEMIGVPKDIDVELDIRFEAVMEGVLVTGTARTPLRGECVRCLEPVTSQTEVNFQELFFYSSEDAAEDDSLLNGDLLDLEPTFRDAVVLTLPLSPVCSEDCTGLCVECGIRLADAEPGHKHEVVDARWAKLQNLIPEHNNDQES